MVSGHTSYLVRNLMQSVNELASYIPEHVRDDVLQSIDDFLQSNFNYEVNSIEYQQAKLNNIVQDLCIHYNDYK